MSISSWEVWGRTTRTGILRQTLRKKNNDCISQFFSPNKDNEKTHKQPTYQKHHNQRNNLCTKDRTNNQAQKLCYTKTNRKLSMSAKVSLPNLKFDVTMQQESNSATTTNSICLSLKRNKLSPLQLQNRTSFPRLKMATCG